MTDYKTLNGFSFGETGYGFNEDGMYSHKYCEETYNMGGLSKTRHEAIVNEIKETYAYIDELIDMLKDELFTPIIPNEKRTVSLDAGDYIFTKDGLFKVNKNE